MVSNLLHLWLIITFMGDAAVGNPVGYVTGEIEI